MDLSRLIPLLAFFSTILLTEALRDARLMRCPPRQLKGGRVRLRSKGRVAKYVCLRRSQVLGDKYSTCIRGKWDSPVPICINSGCAPITVAHGQVLDTYRGALVTVHCDPGFSLVGSQSLFCDGTRWNGTTPFCKELKVTAQKWCDFENEDLCGWTHDTNGDFAWRRHNFATPSGYVGTGPSSDHTLGPGLHGYYMYLETSSPRLENDTARLFSPIFPALKQTSCFIFWYHMFGPTTGSLNVYLHYQDTLLLFSQTGDQGDQWLQAVLPLPAVPTSFQILIEGVRGNGYEGDIAIDDVKLTQGEECTAASTNGQEESSSVSGLDEMSCINRCFNTATDPNWCECSTDCLGNNTCCPDYLQECQNQGTALVETIDTQEPTMQPSFSASSEFNLETNTSPTTSSEEAQSTNNLQGTSFTVTENLPLSSSTMLETSRFVVLTQTTSNTSLTSSLKVTNNTSAASIPTFSTAARDQVNSTDIQTTQPPTRLSSTSKMTIKPSIITTKFPVTRFQTPPPTISKQQDTTVAFTTKTTTLQTILNATSKVLSTKTTIRLPRPSPTLKPQFRYPNRKLEFVTPPSPFMFRTPTMPFRIWPKYPKNPFITTASTTTIRPKYSKNFTAEVAKSKNDVLHPVWANRTFPKPPPLPPLGPLPGLGSTLKPIISKTVLVQHLTSVNVPPSTSTVAYKWKSKYKPKEESPIHAQFAIHSSPNHTFHVVLLICGVLLIFLAVLVTVCVVRRRKINRRSIEDDELDIRFLASDELLDFTLARPSPVRETAR